MRTLSRKQWIMVMHVTAWLSFAVLSLWITAMAIPWDLAASRVLVATGSLMAAFYINSELLIDRFFERGYYLSYLLLALALIAALALIRGWLMEYILLEKARVFLTQVPLSKVPNLPYLLGTFAIGTMVVFSTFLRLAQNRQAGERRLQILAHEKSQAQLDYLKAQINPHFLFNTLNNIYSLAYRKSERAPEMILKLSALLRYVLYDCREDKARLSAEVEHNQLFIEIFQMKREEPYNIRFAAELENEDLLIEPMLFIPLVENSLKHCDLDHNPEAFVDIRLQNQGSRVRFCIENSRDPGDTAKDESGGIGLENVQKRLELNYPDRHRFQVMDQGDRFRVEMEFEAV